MGKIVMRSELLTDIHIPIGIRRKVDLLVVKRWGKYKLVLREVDKGFLYLYLAVNYYEIPETDIPLLRREFTSLTPWFDEVEKLMAIASNRDAISRC
jgi:hypothetical protein